MSNEVHGESGMQPATVYKRVKRFEGRDDIDDPREGMRHPRHPSSRVPENMEGVGTGRAI